VFHRVAVDDLLGTGALSLRRSGLLHGGEIFVKLLEFGRSSALPCDTARAAGVTSTLCKQMERGPL
jgi:hypothetical protein